MNIADNSHDMNTPIAVVVYARHARCSKVDFHSTSMCVCVCGLIASDNHVNYCNRIVTLWLFLLIQRFSNDWAENWCKGIGAMNIVYPYHRMIELALILYGVRWRWLGVDRINYAYRLIVVIRNLSTLWSINRWIDYELSRKYYDIQFSVKYTNFFLPKIGYRVVYLKTTYATVKCSFRSMFCSKSLWFLAFKSENVSTIALECQLLLLLLKNVQEIFFYLT